MVAASRALNLKWNRFQEGWLSTNEIASLTVAFNQQNGLFFISDLQPVLPLCYDSLA